MTRAHGRTWKAALRRLRKAISELEEAAGDVPERLGEILELDDEWREMGRRCEEKMADSVDRRPVETGM